MPNEYSNEEQCWMRVTQTRHAEVGPSTHMAPASAFHGSIPCPKPSPTYELVHTQTAAVSQLRAAQLWWGSEALQQRTSSALPACPLTTPVTPPPCNPTLLRHSLQFSPLHALECPTCDCELGQVAVAGPWRGGGPQVKPGQLPRPHIKLSEALAATHRQVLCDNSTQQLVRAAAGVTTESVRRLEVFKTASTHSSQVCMLRSTLALDRKNTDQIEPATSHA